MKPLNTFFETSHSETYTSHPSGTDERTCLHCGSLFRSNKISTADAVGSSDPNQIHFPSEQDFCCSGCQYVFSLLHEKGLERFYSLRDQDSLTCPIPVQSLSEEYAHLDDPEFLLRLNRKGQADALSIEFFLEGLNCTSCLWLIEKLPDLCLDVNHVNVNMATGIVIVNRKTGGSFAEIARFINHLGYRPHVLTKDTEHDAEALRRIERRRDLIRLGVAGAATGNIMILAVSLYAGADGGLAEKFRWLSAIIATPVITYCSWPFYQSAWASLRFRHLNLDVPIVAAILCGTLVSIWGLAKNTDTLYFDSLSTLVFLLLASRFWLKGVQQNLLDVSNLAEEILASTATRVRQDGTIERVSSLSLQPGDNVRLEGPCSVPSDGSILEGHGTVDTSVLTGESLPSAVEAGHRLEAGSQILSGKILMQIEQPTSCSRLAKILKDTEFSARSKPTTMRLAGQVSQWFVGIVLLTALAVLLIFASKQPLEGVSRALALIIVTCPCVFGMAIPLSMSLAIRSAAKRGLVVKNAEALERLFTVKKVFFDKTGTLTTGNLRVQAWQFLETPFSRHLAAALALEKNQSHPVARAILTFFGDKDLPQVSAQQVHARAGGGIEGQVGSTLYALRPEGIVLNGESTPLLQNISAENAVARSSRALEGPCPHVFDFTCSATTGKAQNAPVLAAKARLKRFASKSFATMGSNTKTHAMPNFTPGEVNGSAQKSAASSFSGITSRYVLTADEKAVAYFDLRDEVRSESWSVVNWFQNQNIQTLLLSGDKTSVVEDCAFYVGIPPKSVIAEATPEEKSDWLKRFGPTSIMVGDGANDAAALASASVGIAIRGGMDLSLRAADIYLSRARLSALPELFEIARRTRQAIRRNLIFSVCFNFVSGTLAVLGLMTPLWAAVLMPLSSLTVLISALTTSRKLEAELSKRRPYEHH